MHSTPQLANLSRFWLVFSARKSPEFRDKKAHHPLPRRRTEWSIWTLLEVTGGTQTHSRRTGRKLGRLPRARQGLVRVPESNTKYGGKAEKTGVAQRRLCCQVSVSPQGFPRKKIVPGGSFLASPRCSQGNYLLWLRGCSGETHVKLRDVRASITRHRPDHSPHLTLAGVVLAARS